MLILGITEREKEAARSVELMKYDELSHLLEGQQTAFKSIRLLITAASRVHVMMMI